MDVNEPDIEAWVRAYHKLGLNPIPIKGGHHDNRDKEPNIESTKPFFYNDVTKEQMEEWLKEGLYQNVALMGGKLACFDLDDPKALTDLNLNSDLIIKEGYWFTETPKEPGRCHIVIGNKGLEKITRRNEEGIDLRCFEHYWLVYPSIHPNGKYYNFLNTKDPNELKLPKEKNALAQWEMMVDKLRKIHGTTEKFNETLKTKNAFDKSPDCIRLAWEHGAKPGNRYYTAIGLGSWLQKKDFPLEMAQSIITAWFKEKCNTDGRPTDDIKNGVKVGYLGKDENGKEVIRYEAKCFYWRQKVKYCPYKEIIDCPYGDEKKEDKLKPELLKEYRVMHEDDNGKIKINCPNLAKLIMYGDNEKYLILKDNQDILKYNGGYYENNGIAIIKNRISYYLGEQTKEFFKTEVVGFIKNFIYTERDKLEQPYNLINVRNGIFNIDTNELIPHSPEFTFQYVLPVDYVPNADCPIWKKFIEDVVYQDDLDFLQEVCGYLLYRKYTWALLIILLGHGRNGKTTFINVLSQLLGKNNVEHIPLQTIAYERFAKAKLYQKHANLCSDLGAKEIKDTGTIKQLTGGDAIFARELYQNGFNFTNYAKLMFACNILPEIGDRSLAMNERIAVVEFPNTFERGNENCDPNLIDKLTTPQELSGIFNWMAEGLKRLLDKKTFSKYRNFENVSDYLKESQNPIKIFTDTYIEAKQDNEIQKEIVYKKYLEFCKANNYPTLVSSWFSQKFKPFAPMGIDEGQPRKSGHKTVWKNIKFKDGLVTDSQLKNKKIDATEEINI
jgi:P4 family phage/plasmid primase-like protien